MLGSEPIPPRIRAELAADPFMLRCIHLYLPGATPCGPGRCEWEHAWTYAKKRVNERWAIVPCDTFHHRGNGLKKDLNEYASLLRMTPDELLTAKREYPRTDWEQKFRWLSTKYPSFRLPEAYAGGAFNPQKNKNQYDQAPSPRVHPFRDRQAQ